MEQPQKPHQPHSINRHAAKAAALLLVLLAGWLSWPKSPSSDTMQQLADRFHFDRISMDDVQKAEVDAAAPLFAPRFQHLEYYLSAFLPTGAALCDLDGDGYNDEVCTTDGFSRKIRVHQLPVNGQPHTFIELPVPVQDEIGVEGTLPSGCLPGDYNKDGRVDLLIYFWGRTPVVFLNESDELSPSSFRAVELLSPVERWYTQSIAQGDVDGDGDLDLAVACYFPDEAKILNDRSTGYSHMNAGLGASFNGEHNRLLIRTSDEEGKWYSVEEDLFADPKLSGAQWTIATALTDLDGDLMPEVFWLNDHGVDRILHNRSEQGELTFVPLINRRDLTTPKSSTFGRDDYHAMGVDFVDLNQDGELDWLISNFGADYLFHQSHFVWMNSGEKELYEQGQAPFHDAAEQLGLARTSGVPWDVRCADFDNDGSSEVFRSIGYMRGDINRMPEMVETAVINDLIFKYPEAWHKFGPNDSLVGEDKPNTFCVMHDGQYVDIGGVLGMMEDGPSRGMTSGDIDLDGLVDFLVTNQRASSTLYHNRSPVEGRSFLGLDLRLAYEEAESDGILVEAVGPLDRPSRPAIGASATVHLGNGKKAKYVVDGGAGFGGKKTCRIHVGLGPDISNTDVVKVDIRWRSLTGNVFEKTVELEPGWHRLWLGLNSGTPAQRVNN